MIFLWHIGHLKVQMSWGCDTDVEVVEVSDGSGDAETAETPGAAFGFWSPAEDPGYWEDK